MNLDEIKQLILLAQETGVSELEVQRGDSRVRVRLAEVTTEVTLPRVPAAAAALPNGAPPLPPPAPPAPAADHTIDANVSLLKSPIVGTFYESPSPGAAAFVKVGDTVRQGQVVCIIESMKLMNEIESEFNGVITARLVENGHAVEYGEALFAVRQA
jgi:acetyl-CoA carboxylase biotin carboxyl carrier protein